MLALALMAHSALALSPSLGYGQEASSPVLQSPRSTAVRATQEARFRAMIEDQRRDAKPPVRTSSVDGKTRPRTPNPYLAFLPEGVPADFEHWQAFLKEQGRAQRAARAQSRAFGEVILRSESEPNNTLATANPIVGFGTGVDDDDEADVTGELESLVRAIGPFAEDDGSIPLANPTGVASGEIVLARGTIGDGPYGIAGTGSGDFDVFEITDVAAGDLIRVDVNTPSQVDGLDPVVTILSSTGAPVGQNDDQERGRITDSFLETVAPAAGTFYVLIAGHNAPVPLDPFDSSTGAGAFSEGDYDVLISVNPPAPDTDIFSVALEAGDIIAANVSGVGQRLRLFDPRGEERIGSTSELNPITPGPFPRGGNASLAYVVEEAGSYAVAVSSTEAGTYILELRVFRSVLEGQASGSQQILFVDFDGATLDMATFNNPPETVVLSPMSSFLPAWGLSAEDESAVIDAVVATVVENLSTDMRVMALNGDFDTSGTAGEFDVVVLNSRDHADPFGGPNVSRVVVGGTIAEFSGIQTIGLAESVDPGNFATEETAVVLLDLLSAARGRDTLNQFRLGGSATKVDLVGVGVGNITAHEAGHFLANFHTDLFDGSANIMDPGGNLAGSIGVGRDRTLGTADDVDVDFGIGAYRPLEGFTGVEDTLNATAFGMATGAAVTSACGDGAVDVGEVCDDGDLLPGDGCDAACEVEPGFACADEPSSCSVIVLGKKLVVRNPKAGAGQAEEEPRRIVSAEARERPTTVPPIEDDPTLDGATLRVVINGTTVSDDTYDLGARGWSAVRGGFKFKNSTRVPQSSPVARVSIRNYGGKFSLHVLLQGKRGTDDLDVVPADSITDGGIRLTLGDGVSYCFRLGGAAGGAVTRDDARMSTIVATGAAPAALVGCP